MATTKKITQLTAATLPLSGSEQLECVQLGNSRKLTARDFVLPTDSVITVSGMGGSLPGSRRLAAGTGITLTDGGAGSTLTIAAPGTGALSANPTGTIGLTAVNGSALTWMRSDAAPALSQAIAPTWTGLHKWSGSAPRLLLESTGAPADQKLWHVQSSSSGGFVISTRTDADGTGESGLVFLRTGTNIDSLTINADAIALNGPVTSAINFTSTGSYFSGTVPQFGIRETDAAVDAGNWLFRVNGGQFVIGGATDAAPTALSTNALQIFRSGIAISEIRLSSTTLLWNGSDMVNIASSPTWTGQHIFSNVSNDGCVSLQSANPRLGFVETDAAADNRRWRLDASGESFNGRVANDDWSSFSSWLTVERTGVTVDSIALTATSVILDATVPRMLWNEASAAVNEKIWDIVASGGDMSFRLRNDLGGAGATFLRCTRTGISIDSVLLTSNNLFLTATAGISISTTTATTVGAAGGASALPATPSGYWSLDVNGTPRKIPYYNA